METDGVKAAARRADAAADALVRIDDARTAAETAGGLGFDLLLGEACAAVLHRAAQLLVVAGALARRVVKAVDIEKNIFLIELDELPAVAADGEARVRLHKAVQGHGALLAGGDGVDGELLAGVGVAADEDVGLGGLVSQRIGLDGAVGVELHLCSGEQLAPGGVLADAVKDRIRLGGFGPGVVKRGGEAALGIFDGQALAEANGPGMAVLGVDRGLAPAGMDGDAVALALGRA